MLRPAILVEPVIKQCRLRLGRDATAMYLNHLPPRSNHQPSSHFSDVARVLPRMIEMQVKEKDIITLRMKTHAQLKVTTNY